MQFETLWLGSLKCCRGGNRTEICLQLTTCHPQLVPEPPEIEPQLPAPIAAMLPSMFLFPSLPSTDNKRQRDTERRMVCTDSPKTVGEDLCPDLCIVFMAQSGPALCPERPEETSP